MTFNYRSTRVSTFHRDELESVPVQFAGLFLPSPSLHHAVGAHCSADLLQTFEFPNVFTLYVLRKGLILCRDGSAGSPWHCQD